MGDGDTCVYHEDCRVTALDNVSRIRNLEMHCNTISNEVEGVKTGMSDFKREFKEVTEALLGEIKDLRREMVSRLPLWATMLIGLLMALLGWSVGKGGF